VTIVEIKSSMQRVRIGLTGLAFVFLVVLLAAVFTSQSADEAPITPNLIEAQRSGTSESESVPAETEPTEPLAELGVAPGKAESNVSDAASASPPSRP
jgi:hypothetical protein